MRVRVRVGQIRGDGGGGWGHRVSNKKFITRLVGRQLGRQAPQPDEVGPDPLVRLARHARVPPPRVRRGAARQEEAARESMPTAAEEAGDLKGEGGREGR